MYDRISRFIIRFRDFIAFTVLAVFSLVLITYGDASRIGGFRSIVIGGSGWLQEAFAWIPNPGALKSENRSLRELNLQLTSEVTRMRKAMIENNRLRGMLALKDTINQPLITSSVVGENTIQLRNYITINKGSADGVTEGMSVRTDAGLVGIIIGVSKNYSLVETLMNPNVKVASKIVRTQLNGIAVWDGVNRLYLKNIPESYDVQVGDIVITSNYSNKYPDEIPVGQIIKAERNNKSLFMDIIIEPFANFKTLEQVFVVKEVTDPQRFALIKQLEKKLKAEQE